MLLHRRSKNSKSPTLSSNIRVCFLIERTKYTNKANETAKVYICTTAKTMGFRLIANKSMAIK